VIVPKLLLELDVGLEEGLALFERVGDVLGWYAEELVF
jgi:hypothetical protein